MLVLFSTMLIREMERYFGGGGNLNDFYSSSTGFMVYSRILFPDPLLLFGELDFKVIDLTED